nr:hypothetical protein L203_03155 [Cryptococcus depauperatus CBS 7841]
MMVLDSPKRGLAFGIPFSTTYQVKPEDTRRRPLLPITPASPGANISRLGLVSTQLNILPTPYWAVTLQHSACSKAFGRSTKGVTASMTPSLAVIVEDGYTRVSNILCSLAVVALHPHGLRAMIALCDALCGSFRRQWCPFARLCQRTQWSASVVIV